MSNQGQIIASLAEALNVSPQGYETMWHLYWDDQGIASGYFNERMVTWLQGELSSSETDINSLMAAYAVSQGVDRWSSLSAIETASFSVALTGLTDNEARIGDHAGISYTTDPVSATETVTWGVSAGDSTYGTGAGPTDFTAGDEGRLWLSVTDNGETVNRSAPIRYAEGTAPAIADGQAWTVDDTAVSIDAAASGANLTFTYSLSGEPAGISVNSSSGLITGTPTGVSSGTITVIATDQYGRTLSDTFTYSSTLRTAATAADGLGPFTWTVDDTSVSVNAATDFTANGNTLTYTATGLPAGVTIASNGTISGTPTAASSGSIVITATDEYGRETTSTTSHTTALRAAATAAGALGPYSFTVDEAITPVAVSSDFTLGGNTLTYTISPALPAGLSMSTAGSITGTPTALSTSSSYTVTGQDEYGRETTSTFDVEVTDEFNPASLFGVGDEGAYFDASDSANLRQLSDGTVAVTAVGDPVGWVEDLSGNGNHATQATSTERPVWARVPEGGRRNELDATATLSTQSVTVTAAQRTLSFTGTGTVTLSGASTAGPLVGTGVSDRVSLTFTPTAGSLTLTVSGSVTAAQLELGASVTGIQTVTADYDITEAGVASKYGLLFDGVDDLMLTPSIDLSGTDEVTLALGGIIPDPSLANKYLVAQTNAVGAGRVQIFANVNRIASDIWGSVFNRVQTSALLVANSPFYAVGRSDISADQSRLDTSFEDVSDLTDQGTGNFLNSAMSIGAQPNGGNAAECFVASAFLIGRYITDTETTDLEATLESKAGIV